MPGVLSARWSGHGSTDESNLRLVLEQIADVPDERRGAAFVCAAALVTPDGAEQVVHGTVTGAAAARTPRRQRLRLRPDLRAGRRDPDHRRDVAGREGRDQPPRQGVPRTRPAGRRDAAVGRLCEPAAARASAAGQGHALLGVLVQQPAVRGGELRSRRPAPRNPAGTAATSGRCSSTGSIASQACASPSGRVNSDRSPMQHVVDQPDVRRQRVARPAPAPAAAAPSPVVERQLGPGLAWPPAAGRSRRPRPARTTARCPSAGSCRPAARRLAQDQADPLRGCRHPLAGAQQERHAAPARRCRSTAGPRRTCRSASPAATPADVAVARRTGRAPPRPGPAAGTQRITFSRAACRSGGAQAGRRLHRHLGGDLEQVRDEHVQHRAGGVVEPGPVGDAERLRHVDLHRLDVLGGSTSRSNRPLAKRSTCRSWVRLLAEEVVDPVDLLLVQHRVHDPVQLAEALRRRAERLLVDHPGALRPARAGRAPRSARRTPTGGTAR